MNCFENVGIRLRDWCDQIRSARGEVIGALTINVIKDLCGKRYFDLPSKFKSYIEIFKEREGVLHYITDYRDHFVHPFHVFLLGYYILHKWKTSNRLHSYTGMADDNMCLKIWFITSIYHDVGYPAEKFEAIVHHFFTSSIGRGMNSQFDWGSVLLADDNIKHIRKLSLLFAKKCKDKGQAKIFEKWFHKRLIEDHDHGALTALMLFNQGFTEGHYKKFVYEAALAIVLHSWRKESSKKSDFNLDKLAIEDFPLAFFLSYCDAAQEWGRSVLLRLLKNENKKRTKKVKLDSTLKNVSVFKAKVEVGIKYWADRKDPVAGRKKLGKVFGDVRKSFESTWYRKNSSTTRFVVAGIDQDDHVFATFGPHYNPKP